MRSALLLVTVLNGLAFSAFAQTTPSALTDLPPAVRNDIARVCLPVQYQSGAAAYRDCIENQIASRDQAVQADSIASDLSSLSFDDRYAIQQVCGTASNTEQCRAAQINELLTLPTPKLSDLSSDEQYVIQQTCFNAQSNQGAAAYRTCQMNEIESISTVSAPVYTALSAIERNALQLQCSSAQPRLANYRNCLLEGTTAASRISNNTTTEVAASSLGDTTDVTQVSTSTTAIRIQPDVEQSSATTVTTDETNAAPRRPRLIVPPTDVEPETNAALPEIESFEQTTIVPEVIPAPALIPVPEPIDAPVATNTESINDANQPDAQSTTDDSSDTTAADAPPIDLAKQWLEQLKSFTLDSFNGLSQQGKILLAALIVMPIALWALLSGRRKRTDEEFVESNHTRENLKRRVRAQNETQDERPDEYEKDEFGPLSANWASEADSLFDDAPTLEHPAMAKPKRAADAELAHSFEEEEEVLAPTARLATPETSLETQHTGFAAWLHNQTPADQLSLSIEFLVYWMAFGDERYDASLKRRIFQTPDPSNHDIIKRWVLKEDVHAFADVIDWIQQNTTSTQKEQIIRLLMALLINGEEPTPVQNTLLRFLSDVFYLENPTLEVIFEQDFGLSLPAIPRVDRLAWWDRQLPGDVSLWDARAINASDELTRHAAQLGVDSDARVEHVEVAYEQAIKRCNPERFGHLSEREHQLIESRRSRLLQAHDELMEALA